MLRQQARAKRETRRLGPTPSVRNMPMNFQVPQQMYNNTNTGMNDYSQQQQQGMMMRPQQSQGQSQGVKQLIAKYPYLARNPDELSFNPGDRLFGFQTVENGLWWYGEHTATRQRGMIPANFVTSPEAPEQQQGGAGNGGSGKGGGAKKSDEEFSNRIPLTLFAHNLANCGALNCLIFGAFSAFWQFQRQDPENTPQKLESLFVVLFIWIYALVIAPFIFIYEYFYGLERQLSASKWVSPRGIAYLILSLPLYVGYPTMIAGANLTFCAFINMQADYNREAGKHISPKGDTFIKLPGPSVFSFPFLLYFAVNAAVTAEATIRFNDIIGGIQATCEGFTNVCPTDFAIAAKVGGQVLNFNCAIILLPVMKSGLRYLNNVQVGRGKMLSQYVPLRKNIVFHKVIAFMTLVATVVHVVAHFINFGIAPEVTLVLFGEFAWFTGAILTFTMVVIYCGAQNRVKRANYEVFFTSHHWFGIFFFFLVAHGPDFYSYAVVPILLYIGDRIYRAVRGNQQFFLRRVLYIPPIMELSFYPVGPWKFKEGQYLYLNAPHLSSNEWHPFTISSAYGDLENADRKEITLHIKIQGFKSWTRNLMEYFSKMAPASSKKGDAFVLELTHHDERGKVQPGKQFGPDGKPLICIDGPHAAPAQVYSSYNEVMLIGAGVGLTPASSILKAICRYKWKKGFSPQVVYFYWVVRHDEIESFRWFVNVLFELEKRVASDRLAGALSPEHRIELNVYVTAAPKAGGPIVEPKKSDGLKFTAAQGMNVGYDIDVGFTEEMLLKALLNPQSPSDQQRMIQARENRDIWIWNGRPKWDDIFQSVKEKRSAKTSSIATCFCGTPVIGKDLKVNCSRASSRREGIRFDLYKENF